METTVTAIIKKLANSKHCEECGDTPPPSGNYFKELDNLIRSYSRGIATDDDIRKLGIIHSITVVDSYDNRMKKETYQWLGMQQKQTLWVFASKK